MNTINMGLRRHVGRAEVSARITQRLKKIPTIIEKLVFREPSLNLNTMHDIGGCRAVVPDLDALERLVSVIVERRADQILKHRNYIDSPRISGYRAHHLIVESNGLPVEIQLRTVSMHKWAETVEGVLRYVSHQPQTRRSGCSYPRRFGGNDRVSQGNCRDTPVARNC